MAVTLKSIFGTAEKEANGISFEMHEGGRVVVLVRVHDLTLAEIAGIPGEAVNGLAVMATFRRDIERAAERAYRAGNFAEDGSLLVTRSDFN